MSLSVNQIKDFKSIDVNKSSIDNIKALWNPDIKAAEADTGATISIYEAIGEDFMGGGMTSKRIAGALRAIGSKDIEVNINSYGGDVFEGIAIHNLLAAHPAKVTVNIVGIAASAASIIAMAGDEILMGEGAMLMIHNAWTIAMGNANDFNLIATQMATIDNSLVDIYVAKTGMKADEVKTMMDNETFINAKDAIDMGFADGSMTRPIVEASQNKDNKLINSIKSITGATNSQARELKALIKTEFGIDSDSDKPSIDCDANELVLMAQALKFNLMKGL